MIVTKLSYKVCTVSLPSDRFCISKKDAANVNLKLSSAREVYPNKLSRIQNNLSEYSGCVRIIPKRLFHSVQEIWKQHQKYKLYVYITREFSELRLQSFQGMIFTCIQTYRGILKTAFFNQRSLIK